MAKEFCLQIRVVPNRVSDLRVDIVRRRKQTFSAEKNFWHERRLIERRVEPGELLKIITDTVFALKKWVHSEMPKNKTPNYEMPTTKHRVTKHQNALASHPGVVRCLLPLANLRSSVYFSTVSHCTTLERR